jgi:hypothetical protein
MSKSIIPDIKKNVRLSTDLDNFRNRYLDVDRYRNTNVRFPSGEIYTYEKNLYILISQSSLVTFRTSWIMRPDYTSYDMYNNEMYWPVILFVNRIYCIEEYNNLDKVLIPPIHVILAITSDKIPYGTVTKLKSTPISSYGSLGYGSTGSSLLDPLGDANLDEGSESGVPSMLPTQVFKQAPLDDMARKRKQAAAAIAQSPLAQAPVDISGTLYEKTERKTLTLTDILNKYVKISYQPINNSSIIVKVDDLDIDQKYGYDYIYKRYTDGENRISWSDDDCTFGIGMENSLQVGDVLLIKYVHGTGKLANICYDDSTCTSGYARFYPEYLDKIILWLIGMDSRNLLLLFDIIGTSDFINENGISIGDSMALMPSNEYPEYDFTSFETNRIYTYLYFLLGDTNGDGYLGKTDFDVIIEAAENLNCTIPTKEEFCAAWLSTETEDATILKNSLFTVIDEFLYKGYTPEGEIFYWTKNNVGTGSIIWKDRNILFITGNDTDIQIYQDCFVNENSLYDINIRYYDDHINRARIEIYDITDGEPGTLIFSPVLPASTPGIEKDTDVSFTTPVECYKIRFIVYGGDAAGARINYTRVSMSGLKISTFSIFDSDKDGLISINDTISSSERLNDLLNLSGGYLLRPAIAAITWGPLMDAIFNLPQYIFDYFDTNGDGYISISNLQSAADSFAYKIQELSDGIDIFNKQPIYITEDVYPQYSAADLSNLDVSFRWNYNIGFESVVVWYKNGVSLVSGSSPDWLIVTNDGISILRFNTIHTTDAGIYYCHASEPDTSSSVTSSTTSVIVTT